MQDGVRGLRQSVAVGTVLALTTAAAAACSANGTVGTGKPTGQVTSVVTVTTTKAPPTGQSLISGTQGSPTASTSSSSADATVTQDEAAAALTAYQTSNNLVNAGLDIQGEAKIESGSLLTLDQGSLLYTQGIGGSKAEAVKVPQTFKSPTFYIPRSATYPRGFFATLTAVQQGAPDSPTLLHFTQDHAGAPWFVDTTVVLTAGKQWPAFAVGPDGLLDYSATKLDELPLSTTDMVAADRKMLSNGDAGKPGSPFVSDDVSTTERKWIQDGVDGVSPASVALTVTTALNPLPTYLPLKDGGELAIYGTKLSLKVSQAGRTFTFGDQGWAKVAGSDTATGGFVEDSLWMVGAIDPPDKSGKIQKIAYNGGLVSVEH